MGDTSDVTYPGWIPADRVEPSISVDVSFDSLTNEWNYGYTVANGSTAEQSIITFDMHIEDFPADQDLVAAAAPDEWSAGVYPDQNGISGAGFAANRSSDPPGTVWSPALDEIAPGASLSGFSLTSPYPPGYARTYVQGYVPLPFLIEEAGVDFVVPHDTTNSQRGWTLGPTLYDEVLTPGDDGLTTDNFLGWMNISDFATIPIDPAPIALKFSVVGETVFPETFRATLNGVEVTASFLPGPSDGADRVAVFRLGSSPLTEGVNVIETSIEGSEGFTGVRGVDLDVMRFRVDPQCSVPQTIVCPS